MRDLCARPADVGRLHDAAGRWSVARLRDRKQRQPGGYFYFPLLGFAFYVTDTTTPGLPSNALTLLDFNNPAAGPALTSGPPPDAGTD